MKHDVWSPPRGVSQLMLKVIYMKNFTRETIKLVLNNEEAFKQLNCINLILSKILIN